GIKFFFKEDLIPDRSNRAVFRLAPYLAIVPAFLSFAVVPFGGTISIAGHTTRLQLADPPVGILLLLAMSSLAVYGVMLAGWSSGSKYPLLGSVRATAQMISYEAALGLSVATVVLVAGSLYTSEIVASQADSLIDWNLIRTGFVPFAIFCIAATAELNRPPFDLVEAEQELVGGFHTEYSSIRFALFFQAEFMNVVTMSAVIVTLFLGGPQGPLLFGPDWIWPIFWFFLKLFEFSFTNRRDAVYTKDELLVGDDGKPQRLPWEDWREGDDAHTSAWMRATSPSGAAEYEDTVQWSGELGYGVREPEKGQAAE
ncbi:MAG TPA: complex I subunit 1 family protein, partial [Acidimicrobiales bacterium]|nr:complex I subunit 1 family protein [Acidimicrobiales bacterium]